MRNWMSVLVVAGLTSVAFVAGVAVGAKETKQVNHPAADLTWSPMMPDVPQGPQVSPLWGNPRKGAHFTLVKIPAGMTSPQHTHNFDVNAVVVQGSMSHWMDGQTQADGVALGPGSHWMTPGKMKHVSACAAGADCIFVAYQPGKMDLKVTEAPKPAEAPKAPAPK